MKCGLMQILAVAMVLGHTVLTPGLSMLGHELDTAMETGAHAVSDVTRDARLAESNRKGLNRLDAALDAVKQQLTSYNLLHFDNADEGQSYFIVDKLFNIRKRAIKYTHEDQTMLLDNVGNEINALIEQLRKNKQKIENYITQHEKYIKQIDEELTKIRNTRSLSGVNIQLIHDICNEEAINFPNIGEHISLEQMIEELTRVKDTLSDDIKIEKKILPEVRDLLNHIIMNPIRTRRDISDTQSMRNVIGISITVCAIVTVCIVLLIAVNNRHQTNTGVRLHEWV